MNCDVAAQDYLKLLEISHKNKEIRLGCLSGIILCHRNCHNREIKKQKDFAWAYKSHYRTKPNNIFETNGWKSQLSTVSQLLAKFDTLSWRKFAITCELPNQLEFHSQVKSWWTTTGIHIGRSCIHWFYCYVQIAKTMFRCNKWSKSSERILENRLLGLWLNSFFTNSLQLHVLNLYNKIPGEW